MKHKELSYLLIAALFQGLLFLYPLSGNTGIFFVLFYFCPLPLFYIGSAWNYKYLSITSLVTFAVISIYGLKLAIAYAIIFALPAIYFSYYLNLHVRQIEVRAFEKVQRAIRNMATQDVIAQTKATERFRAD
jgi:hypothetical protein